MAVESFAVFELNEHGGALGGIEEAEGQLFRDCQRVALNSVAATTLTMMVLLRLQPQERNDGEEHLGIALLYSRGVFTPSQPCHEAENAALDEAQSSY